ncbi:O-methyltransferase [Flavobacterium sp. WC2409]|uniref:O-methyltransferase n=1 Tax=Flavobacterium sp. WC2409 TaxID=3234139 RepID=A0AB39W7F5_9FLAO
MISFDTKIDTVLKTYHQRIETESILMKSLPVAEGMKRRDEFLLSVGLETAIFINTLIKSAHSKIILELGTSYGYSTIWLAEAARANGGRVITLENNIEKAAYAKQKIEEAGLSDFVEWRIGDALENIANATEKFDFVLVDIWKELYLPCFDLFYPKLNPEAWVLSDNMVFPPHSLQETTLYKNRILETQAFDTVLLPIGSGIELSFLKNK